MRYSLKHRRPALHPSNLSSSGFRRTMRAIPAAALTGFVIAATLVAANALLVSSPSAQQRQKARVLAQYFDGPNVGTVVPGDTIPDGSYVLFDRGGISSNAVTFQTRVALARAPRFGGGSDEWTTNFSPPDSADTLGILVGPYEYAVVHRSRNVLGTPNQDDVIYVFAGGFSPRVHSLSPDHGDELVARQRDRTPWPGNSVAYSWADDPHDGRRYWNWEAQQWEFTDVPDPSWIAMQGDLLRYRVRFEGSGDPREFSTHVRSWSYTLVGEHDPANRVKEGSGFDMANAFIAGTEDDVLLMDELVDGPAIFVPRLMWTLPDLFAPGAVFDDIGRHLARGMGWMQLSVEGKTTKPGDTYPVYPFSVRPTVPLGHSANRDLGRVGRVSAPREGRFRVRLGLDPLEAGSISGYFPPDDIDATAPALVGATLVDPLTVELRFDEAVTGGVESIANYRVFQAETPSMRPPVIATSQPHSNAVMLSLGGDGLDPAIAYTAAVRHLRDAAGNTVESWVSAAVSLHGTDALPSNGRKLVLHQNAPNPFNPTTTIRYRLEGPAVGSLKVYDISGRLVRVLRKGRLSAGEHAVPWDGRDDAGRRIASGVYLYRLVVDEEMLTRRMVLLK